MREEVDFSDKFAVIMVEFHGGAAEFDGESEERKHSIVGCGRKKRLRGNPSFVHKG